MLIELTLSKRTLPKENFAGRNFRDFMYKKRHFAKFSESLISQTAPKRKFGEK